MTEPIFMQRILDMHEPIAAYQKAALQAALLGGAVMVRIGDEGVALVDHIPANEFYSAIDEAAEE